MLAAGQEKAAEGHGGNTGDQAGGGAHAGRTDQVWAAS